MPANDKHLFALFSMFACAVLTACSQPAPAINPTPALATPPPQAAAPTTVPATEVLPTSEPTVAATELPTPVATTVATVPATATAPLPTVVAPPLNRTLALRQPAIQGDDVLALQQRLLALNYSQLGSADGIFGKNTEEAVRIFQTLNQLSIDGVVGPNTWSFLFDADAVRYDFHPIVANAAGYLLGAANAGTWLSDAQVVSITGELQYAMLKQQGAPTNARGNAAMPPDGPPCPYTYYVDFASPLTDTQPVAVGNLTWNTLPRPINEVPTDTVTLQKPVTSALRVLSLANPVVRITRALHGDLDGDGRQETIVAMFYRTDGSEYSLSNAEPGDYSAILVIPDGSDLASVVASDVVTKVIEFGAPTQFTLLGVWDLNGDGKMEIVAGNAYYEGDGVSIFTLTGNASQEVLSTGCGV